MRSLYQPKSINGDKISGPVTINGTLTVTGLSTLNSVTVPTTLGVTGTSTLGIVNTSGLATVNSLAVTNNADITGTLTSTGNFRTFGTARVDGTSSLIGAVTGSSTITATRFIESSGVTTVTANTSYVVLPTDRYVLISTTGAGGPFTITFPNISYISMVTIRMTAFNTAIYTASGVNQGNVNWSGADEVATFISNPGSATWSLIGAPQPTTMI